MSYFIIEYSIPHSEHVDSALISASDQQEAEDIAKQYMAPRLQQRTATAIVRVRPANHGD